MPNAHAHRLTSRVLLFDREGHLLLFLTLAPDSSGVARWLTPGGGVDPGEDHLTAARRELWEETGLVVDELGPTGIALDFDVPWDSADHDTGHAEYWTLTTDRFAPSSANWTEDEHVDVLAHRWWSLDELAATDELVEPADLADLARPFAPGLRGSGESPGQP